MAATRPTAVANSASAMPGATTAREVFLEAAIERNAVMMPQTVPKRPTKGLAEATVASTSSEDSSFSTSRPIETSSTLSMRVCSPMKEAFGFCTERFHSRIAATKSEAVPFVGRGDLVVELVERIARPEGLVEKVHRAAGAPNQQALVDDDHHAPDRRAEQPDDHAFNDDMGAPEHAPDRDLGDGGRKRARGDFGCVHSTFLASGALAGWGLSTRAPRETRGRPARPTLSPSTPCFARIWPLSSPLRAFFAAR